MHQERPAVFLFSPFPALSGLIRPGLVGTQQTNGCHGSSNDGVGQGLAGRITPSTELWLHLRR